MNKNLENEYKQLMNTDVPDLWAWIESGLDMEQDTPTQDTEAAAAGTEDRQDKNRSQAFRNSQRRKSSRRGINYRLWGVAAAACICVAVAFPVWLLSNSKNADGSGMSESAQARADTSAVQNIATADTSASMDSASMDDISMDTADKWEEAEMEEAFLKGNADTENTDTETIDMEAAADLSGLQSDRAVSTAEKENSEAAAADAVSNTAAADLKSQSRAAVTATVIIRGVEEAQSQIIYTAEVKQATDAALVGTQIEIYADTEPQERLEEDAEYRLELTAVTQEDGKIIFIMYGSHF
ncbi:MAG: hypothetical protein NC337_08090 [Roseburia sp.]|nr:hypothetical protein [Roseburia sp.]